MVDASVSYTHLDVYKRQLLFLPENRLDPFLGILRHRDTERGHRDAGQRKESSHQYGVDLEAGASGFVPDVNFGNAISTNDKGKNRQ